MRVDAKRAAVAGQGAAPASVVAPIRDEDLDAVCAFWQEKFRSVCSVEIWQQAFRQNWAADKPNNGFLLRKGSEIVGALGAIYSDQTVDGKLERFCNMTSWYVADEHRGRSLTLLLHLIRQDGFTFTNLSASPGVEEVLVRTGFTALSKELFAVPNLALPFHLSSRVQVLDDPARIAPLLAPERRQICLDHAGCSRTIQLAIGTENDDYCHVMFSRCGCRHVPCAIIHDVAAPKLLARFWRHFASYALYRTGALITRIEGRLLDEARLPLAVRLTNRSGALYLSRTVGADAISRRYSEVMVLSGC